MLGMVYLRKSCSRGSKTRRAKYLAGAPAICQCFAARLLSLGVCDPDRSRLERALSSVAYLPKRFNDSKES